jgi:hypothetical protein
VSNRPHETIRDLEDKLRREGQVAGQHFVELERLKPHGRRRLVLHLGLLLGAAKVRLDVPAEVHSQVKGMRAGKKKYHRQDDDLAFDTLVFSRVLRVR